MGMEQVSDPPADTRVKGLGGKQVSKARQPMGSQEKNKPTFTPRADLHLYRALGEYALFFSGIQGISAATSVHKHKRENQGILVILFLGCDGASSRKTHGLLLLPGCHQQEKQPRHGTTAASGVGACMGCKSTRGMDVTSNV